jgi:hypothetical protein
LQSSAQVCLRLPKNADRSELERARATNVVPRRVLPGLLRCVACGAGMATNGRDKSVRVRIRCSAAKESGTCSDAKTFYLDAVEKAVLGGLRAEMRAPKVIAEYVRTYLDERKRLAASSNAKRQRLEQRPGLLDREIDRLVDAIERPRRSSCAWPSVDCARYGKKTDLRTGSRLTPMDEYGRPHKANR